MIGDEKPDEPNAMENDDFRKKLQALLNYHSRENGSGTPDFILADYLTDCLENFDRALQAREMWYGRPLDGAA